MDSPGVIRIASTHNRIPAYSLPRIPAYTPLSLPHKFLQLAIFLYLANI